jgi:hypothetical protein
VVAAGLDELSGDVGLAFQGSQPQRPVHGTTSSLTQPLGYDRDDLAVDGRLLGQRPVGVVQPGAEVVVDQLRYGPRPRARGTSARETTSTRVKEP